MAAWSTDNEPLLLSYEYIDLWHQRGIPSNETSEQEPNKGFLGASCTKSDNIINQKGINISTIAINKITNRSDKLARIEN